MSTQIWIDETRDMLLSGYVEDLDIITGEVLVGASQIIVQGYASSIVKGVVVEINAEYEKMSDSQKEGLLSPKAIDGLGE